MSESERLRARFIAFRKAHRISLRDVQKQLHISNAFLSQFENGVGISYENGLKLDKMMKEVGEPVMCEKCKGEGYLK